MTRFSEYDKKEVNLLARIAGRGEREGAPPGGAPERVMSVDDEKVCYCNLVTVPVTITNCSGDDGWNQAAAEARRSTTAKPGRSPTAEARSSACEARKSTPTWTIAEVVASRGYRHHWGRKHRNARCTYCVSSPLMFGSIPEHCVFDRIPGADKDTCVRILFLICPHRTFTTTWPQAVDARL